MSFENPKSKDIFMYANSCPVHYHNETSENYYKYFLETYSELMVAWYFLFVSSKKSGGTKSIVPPFLIAHHSINIVSDGLNGDFISVSFFKCFQFTSLYQLIKRTSSYFQDFHNFFPCENFFCSNNISHNNDSYIIICC